jgi:hypothetical protein
MAGALDVQSLMETRCRVSIPGSGAKEDEGPAGRRAESRGGTESGSGFAHKLSEYSLGLGVPFRKKGVTSRGGLCKKSRTVVPPNSDLYD